MELRKILEDIKEDISLEKVKEWIEKHPNPDDDDVHALANKNKWDPHELEEVIYKITSTSLKNSNLKDDIKSKVVKFAKTHGKSSDPTEKFSKQQINIGKKVELEHGFGPEVANQIARDHLKEKDDYYTYLKKMEKQMDKTKGKKGK